MISRRQLLHFTSILSLCLPIVTRKYLAIAGDIINDKLYPLTVDLLKEAYREEMIASIYYREYCQKALSDDYRNIAYLFFALSTSEKTHADNYQKLIVSLGGFQDKIDLEISTGSTKENLNIAAIKELEKIEVFYPEMLEKLASESHDEAIINCMYSLKSHQQHEEMINKIKKYSGLFFRSLAKKIEKMNPNYYVCEICGSTIDEKPGKPCIICNYPLSHYKNLERPTLLTNL